MTESISLVEASQRLGVHYMTAYRYVRTGRLRATKQGGQWHVAPEDFEAFVDGEPTNTLPRKELIPQLLSSQLLAGDENGVFQLLESAMASGADCEEVYLDLLSPALVDIGQQWHDAGISIADEHLASSTAIRVVSRLGARMGTRGRSRGTIVLAAVAGDHHGLPSALIRDILRSRGYEVIDLGANTPPESLVQRANETEDLIGIGLCATTPGNDEIVKITLSMLNESFGGPIVVGGSAFVDTDHIESLGSCIASRTPRHLLSLFDEIHSVRSAS